MSNVFPNTPYPLRLQLSDGVTNLFPQATIWDGDSVVIPTVNLTHISDGLYGADVTFPTEGYFTAVYRIYTDAGRTQLSGIYPRSAENFEVFDRIGEDLWDALLADHLSAGSIGEAIAITRGLLQHNYILDNPTYNTQGLLLTGRIRVFRSKADTDAEVNPLATYTIDGTAQAGPLAMLGQKLKVTRDP